MSHLTHGNFVYDSHACSWFEKASRRTATMRRNTVLHQMDDLCSKGELDGPPSEKTFKTLRKAFIN